MHHISILWISLYFLLDLLAVALGWEESSLLPIVHYLSDEVELRGRVLSTSFKHSLYALDFIVLAVLLPKDLLPCTVSGCEGAVEGILTWAIDEGILLSMVGVEGLSISPG